MKEEVSKMNNEYSKAGDRIYRYDEKKTGWRPPTYGEEGWSEKIEECCSVKLG
jgi:hypothetical protein